MRYTILGRGRIASDVIQLLQERDSTVDVLVMDYLRMPEDYPGFERMVVRSLLENVKKWDDTLTDESLATVQGELTQIDKALTDVEQRVQRFLGDIKDPLAVNEAVSVSDGVIHLASLADSEVTEDDPATSIMTNLIGACNVFQACRQHVKRCSYLVPDSVFNAAALAFMFNRKHDTEIAVIRPTAGADTKEVAELLVKGLVEDHFQYAKPLTPAIVTR